MKEAWTINGKRYEKLNKTQAQKAYLSGITICLCPANCNPNFIGAPLYNINIHDDYEISFSDKVRDYMYYNRCSGTGWKNYTWYFIEQKDRTAQILLSDARGIYIPRDFLPFANRLEKPMSEADKACLENPENDYYWEVWEEVLNGKYGALVDDSGERWILWQDGDLYAVHESFEQEFYEERGDFY